MRKGRVLAFLLLIIAIVYGIYQYTPLIRGNGISIVVDSPKAYYSPNKEISIHVNDRYAGIKSIKVKIISLNTDVVLFEKRFSDPFVRSFNLNFKANKVVPEGKATFVVEIEDYSKSNYLNGFTKRISFPVVVDSTPPKVILLSGTGRISVGGTALAVFYVNDVNLSNIYLGVRHDGVLDKFKAYRADKVFSNPHVYMSFFTYRLSKVKDYSTDIYATDKAGNISVVHIPVYYNSKPIRKSKIKITDGFIKTKVWTILQREGLSKKETLLGDFLLVNDVVRAKNAAKIKQICSSSQSKFLWKGRFEQLKDSKVTATFNDKRLYYYNGKLVDVKYHKGYDLASIRNARVNAANSGRVVFEGYLGVYGNAMLIDHGFGVFSLYGHLQTFLVKEGSYVRKGQYVAITDTTGLAGGDHLHFDIVVDGYYVNPIEWWDRNWIKTHIYKVIDESRTRLSLINQ
ncbi:M23 family metallopeptidase [Hippea maritima]|uniref:Peptidase M23 n=1 Tax=Hippea maritima (strain ATCC 700847 / DSM 10411 / MH2) TaxID=760142 RepID=F2LTH7_HIPMA|nr:M23 family metallopeptidase [Hippea maritima]AEA33302.1 Peptidase M23 [Hippea maritima DSM 10411]